MAIKIAQATFKNHGKVAALIGSRSQTVCLRWSSTHACITSVNFLPSPRESCRSPTKIESFKFGDEEPRRRKLRKSGGLRRYDVRAEEIVNPGEEISPTESISRDCRHRTRGSCEAVLRTLLASFLRVYEHKSTFRCSHSSRIFRALQPLSQGT